MKVAATFCVLCGMTSCQYLNKEFGLQDDNFIEEEFEDLIQDEIGIQIDLTPDSPEVR